MVGLSDQDKRNMDRMTAYHHLEACLWLIMKFGLCSRQTQVAALTRAINKMLNRLHPPFFP